MPPRKEEDTGVHTAYQSLGRAQPQLDKLMFGSDKFASYWKNIQARAGVPGQFIYFNYLACLCHILAPGTHPHSSVLVR